ncbi:MAG: hypothetical protein KAH32_09160, partial [Chlamydiia bacterium]|nr:hypothetical protein [Chlamydiia bacterium]
YKVDVDAHQELGGAFGIQSIPSLLFVPMEGQPQMAVGALPKDAFIKGIADVLKVTLDTEVDGEVSQETPDEEPTDGKGE